MPVMLDEGSVPSLPLRVLLRYRLGVFSWSSLRSVVRRTVDEHEEEDRGDVALEGESFGERVIGGEGGVDYDPDLRA